MSDFAKSLVEAEVLLRQLEPQYKNKIPNSFWNYIRENKDKNYKFYIDFNKTLENQNIMSDTIAIITYVNIEYLLNEEQKNFLKKMLKTKAQIAELKKKEKYSINIFNERQKEKTVNTDLPISISEKWPMRIINKIKSFLRDKYYKW